MVVDVVVFQFDLGRVGGIDTSRIRSCHWNVAREELVGVVVGT